MFFNSSQTTRRGAARPRTPRRLLAGIALVVVALLVLAARTGEVASPNRGEG